MRFQAASDQALLLRFGDAINAGAHQQVRKLLRLLETEPISGVSNLNPAYCSLLVSFDALQLEPGELQRALGGYVARLDEVRLPEPRQLEIPVSYGGELGPDLEQVASLHGMTPAEVIELHTSVTYLVYFLGFVPGFAYLGELPPALETPRLARPRVSVAPGSIGIAGKQTGVYPFAVPGGWNLIGRTPLAMLRHDQTPASLLSIGDHVRFTAVSEERFAALGGS